MLFEKFNNYLDIIRYQSQKYNHKDLYIFLSDGEDRVNKITYFELLSKVETIASNLQKDLKIGDRVLILCAPGIEFNISFIGCLFAGLIPVPLYPPDTRSLHRVVNILDDCSAQGAIASSSTIEKFFKTFDKNNNISAEFLDVLRKIKLFDIEILEKDAGNIYHMHNTSPHDVAYLQYTSGSTSRPKGVMVTHSNIVHNTHYIADYFRQTDKDIDVSWIPPFHDMGLIKDLMTTIYTGSSLVFMSPYSFLRKPIRWLRAITNYKHLGEVIAGGPNFAYDLCVDTLLEGQIEELDLSHWRIAYNGSEPVRVSTLENFYQTFKSCGFQQKALEPVYGLAEATLMVAAPLLGNNPVVGYVDKEELKNNKARFLDQKNDQTLNVVCSGSPIKEHTTLIVNPDTLTPCKDTKVGEIWVKGPSITSGYFNNPEATSESFGAYLTTGDGPFLRTGDLGFIENKHLYITGRLKDLIIISGNNHYPQDIELTAFRSHKSLRENCGIAFSVPVDDIEHLVFVSEIKRSDLKTVDLEEVKQNISQAIFQNHGISVRKIVLIESSTIPKTSSGKLQRKLCKQQFLENQLLELKCVQTTVKQ